MFFDRPSKDLNVLEQLLEKHERATNELVLRMDALDREYSALMAELEVTPQQISTFLGNPSNFTEEQWEALQNQRKMLDEKLTTDINNIRNPIKTKKAQAERNVQNHWLFVR